MSESIRPFSIAIAQDQLDDLNRRLDMVRWPDPEVVDGWSQGVPLAAITASNRQHPDRDTAVWPAEEVK